LKQKAHLSASSIMASVLSGPAAPLPAKRAKTVSAAAGCEAPRGPPHARATAAAGRAFGVGFLGLGRRRLGRKAGGHDLLTPHRLLRGAQRRIALEVHDAATQLLHRC
jgi:hypothetical protein